MVGRSISAFTLERVSTLEELFCHTTEQVYYDRIHVTTLLQANVTPEEGMFSTRWDLWMASVDETRL